MIGRKKLISIFIAAFLLLITFSSESSYSVSKDMSKEAIKKHSNVFFNESYAWLEWTNGIGTDIGRNGKAFEVTDIDENGRKEIIFISTSRFYTGIDKDMRSAIHIIECENGFYEEIWKSQDFNTYISCLEVDDIDDDGVFEILVGGYDHLITIISCNTFEIENEISIDGEVIGDLDIGDVDNDGEKEIVVFNGVLTVLNGIDLSIEWESQLISELGSVVEMIDLDNDSQQEILVGTFEWANGRLIIFDGVSHMVQWESPIFDDMVSSISVSDVDNDDVFEIIIGSWDVLEGYFDAGVHVFDSENFMLEWDKPIIGEGTGCTAIAVDIDDDGVQEIVISETNCPYLETPGSYIFIYNGITYELEWENGYGDWILGPYSLIVDDIDNDYESELLIGRGRGSIQVLDGDDLVEEWSSWYPGFRAFQVEVDDIDDDLIDEIVVGTEEGYVYALNGETKEEEWRSDLLTPLYYPDASLRSLVIIDIDDDFCKEIIVGMTTGIWIFNGVTKVVEWYKEFSGDSFLQSLAVNDVDNDGVNEIIVGMDYMGVPSDSLVAYDAITHNVEWDIDNLGIIGPISLNDIDLDNDIEIIVNVNFIPDQYIYVFDGETHSVEWISEGYRGYGAMFAVTTSNVDRDDALEILFSPQGGHIYAVDGISNEIEWISEDVGSVVVGLYGEDIDFDGIIEIIVGSWGDGIYVFDGESHEQEWYSTDIFEVSDVGVADIDNDQMIEIIGGDDGYLYVFNVNMNGIPTVNIDIPEKALYFNNKMIIPFFLPIIIGSVDVEVTASDPDGIEKVEFFVDNEYKESDSDWPYRWSWNDHTPFNFRHTLKVVAYDNFGFQNSSELIVWKVL